MQINWVQIDGIPADKAINLRRYGTTHSRPINNEQPNIVFVLFALWMEFVSGLSVCWM
jgi:hypothetical protein